MVEGVKFEEYDCCLIESDNCQHYKSAESFHDSQDFANKWNIPLIRVFGIAGHGKGEVDHVWGIVKVAVRREVWAGSFFTGATDMVDFLANKFQDREAAKYLICEIDASYLVQERARAKLRVFPTVEGSSTFQVMVFTPGKLSFKAAIRICLCNECKCKYGSYEMFQEYEMISHTLNKVSLRSSTTDTSDDQSYEETNAEKFLLEGTICAIAADVNSIDTFWLIKIIDD